MQESSKKTVFDATGAVVGSEVVLATAPASSVEISVDSKGQHKPVVKVYHEDPEHALATALRLYQEALSVLATLKP